MKRRQMVLLSGLLFCALGSGFGYGLEPSTPNPQQPGVGLGLRASLRSRAVPSLLETVNAMAALEPVTSSPMAIPVLPRRAYGAYASALPAQSGRALRGEGRLFSRAPGQASGVACGPSPAVNTLACFDLATGKQVSGIPVPGAVSMSPLYADDSWLIGTAKGFLLRTNKLAGSTLVRSGIPVTGASSLGLWGSENRKIMAAMKASAMQNAPGSDSAAKETRAVRPPEWKWIYTAGSEFIGQPVLADGVLYVLTASQFLHALDWDTGRALWTLRLAPDTALRLTGTSLTALPGKKEVVVGTSEGVLVALSAKDGGVQWRHRVPSKAGERFSGIVAKPLVVDQQIIVVSAEGTVQSLAANKCAADDNSQARCAGESRLVEWSYPIGSVAEPKVLDTGLFVGGFEGSLVQLDLRTGAVRSRLSLFPDSAVSSLTIVRSDGRDFVMAASAFGEIALVEIKSQGGVVRDMLPALGEPVGEFFAGREASESCLSFSPGGFRCFSIL